MNEQARRYIPPNQVRYPADRQFASSCSPPRLATTQLLSASGSWLAPARTSTVLCVRLHGRTHSGVRRNPENLTNSRPCFRRGAAFSVAAAKRKKTPTERFPEAIAPRPAAPGRWRERREGVFSGQAARASGTRPPPCEFLPRRSHQTAP